MKTVTAIVGSKIVLAINDLSCGLFKQLKAACTYRDPHWYRMRAMGYPPQGPKFMRTYDLSSDGQRIEVWRGELRKLRRLFKANRVALKLKDERLWLPQIRMRHTIELRDYQQHPSATMVERQQALVRGPCSSGKSETALAAIAKLGQPALVLVWQERQQRVWLERIRRYFSFEPGGIGGKFKQPTLAPITIGMYQSIRNKLDLYRESFGAVVVDEVQRASAPTFSAVINNLPAAVRIGISDDERRSDQREFLIYATFGKLAAQIAPRTGQCEVKIDVVESRARLYEVADNRPQLINQLTADADRNALIVNLAAREAANGGRVLIWSDRLRHCRVLLNALTERGIEAGLLIGGPEWRDEANRVEEGLASGEVQVAIGTSVAEQSINVPELSAGIMTCASGDKRGLRFKQMRGRLARPLPGQTKIAKLYYVFDSSVPGLSHNLRNISSRYKVRRLHFDRQQKETERMLSNVEVTIESLRAGAKALGMKLQKGVQAKTLEKRIQRELAKDKTYGGYGCEVCGRDLSRDLSFCPFCGTKFRPDAPDEIDDDEGLAAADDEEEGDDFEEVDADADDDADDFEDGDSGEEEGDDDFEEDDEGADTDDDDFEEVDEGEADDDFDEAAADDDDDDEFDEDDFDAEEEDDDFGEGEGEEEEEPEPPKRRKKASKKKVAKKTPRSSKSASKRKAEDRAAKRERIKNELPYSRKALEAMNRSTLVMVAGVIGIKNPVGAGDAATLTKKILIAQKRKFGASGASAGASRKKKTSKKKTRRRRS